MGIPPDVTPTILVLGGAILLAGAVGGNRAMAAAGLAVMLWAALFGVLDR